MTGDAREIDYVETITDVREITLTGSSDLAFWKRYLEGDNLVPVAVDDEARILISGVESHFRGIRFREIVIAVCVEADDGGDAVFLLQAFNSIRFFAWVERTMFSTPYHPASVSVDLGPPGSIGVTFGGEDILGATMRVNAGSDLVVSDRDWKGSIYLPGGARYFCARLEGEARSRSFVEEDSVWIVPEISALEVLAESGFRGEDWSIRRSGVHARSRTYQRHVGAPMKR